MNASRSTAATAVSQLSASSTGGTDGGTECGGDDSSDEGSNNGAAAATAAEEEPAMPEEVFKWMTHTVNQDFVRLGYPTILTKSADQEFVSLCPLIRNCSSVLTLLKARRCSSVDATAAASAADSTLATAAGGPSAPATSAASTLSRRKRRRWGLFSGGKQNRRGAAAGRQSATHQHQQHQQHPHHQQQQQQTQSEATDSLHESMAKKMRRDTERIIRRTRCLDAGALQTAGLQESAPYPEGSAARSDFSFVRSTWRSFRKLAQARIVECAESTKRAEELQRQLTKANAEVERLRSSVNSSNQQLHQQASSTTSSQETSGKLQRVGGFLRRAVSRERLTFGRSSSRSDISATHHQQQQLGHHSETRSRASSQPPPMATAAAATSKDADTELQRVRMEFDRRERLLLSEREKLRQANSKLTFRIQYLSGLASAAAKQQQHQQQQQQAAGGPDHGARIDRRLRRAERRVSELRRETSDLRKSLSEKTEALGNIATAAAQLQRHIDETADKTPIEIGAKETLPPPPPADEPAQLVKFVESTCQGAVSRIQRLQRQCTEAEARVAALTECLRPAAAAPAAKFNQMAPNGTPSPAPSAALSATPSVQAIEGIDQTLEQTQFELINRIKNQLAAMGLDRQDEKTRQLKDAGRAAGSGDAEKSHHSVYTETLKQLQQQQQQQQRRTRRASHDPRSQNNSYFY